MIPRWAGTKLRPQSRLLPSFIVFGSQRCGTTSLYHYLTQHPCIAASLRKEVHFFDHHYTKGESWYRAHFPTVAEQKSAQHLITGEASPYYIFHPLVASRVAAMLPDVKLIALLRNPIDRAHSHYYHERKKGAEPLSFAEAIEREPERLRGEREKIIADPNYYGFSHHHHSYLTRGIYVDQLKVWMEHFRREQFLIIKSEDFYSDPGTTTQRIFEFLDLPPQPAQDYRNYNSNSYKKMDGAMRSELIEFYQPHNARLAEYLGMSFDWDK